MNPYRGLNSPILHIVDITINFSKSIIGYFILVLHFVVFIENVFQSRAHHFLEPHVLRFSGQQILIASRNIIFFAFLGFICDLIVLLFDDIGDCLFEVHWIKGWILSLLAVA